MAGKTNCECCAYYVYDDDYDYYYCDMNLDEDEMRLFIESSFENCPYYSSDDEYAVARKQ